METTRYLPKCTEPRRSLGMSLPLNIIGPKLITRTGSRSWSTSTLNGQRSPIQTFPVPTFAMPILKRPTVAEVSATLWLITRGCCLIIAWKCCSKKQTCQAFGFEVQSFALQSARVKSHRRMYLEVSLLALCIWHHWQADLLEAELKDCHFTSCDLRGAKLDWVSAFHHRALVSLSNYVLTGSSDACLSRKNHAQRVGRHAPANRKKE